MLTAEQQAMAETMSRQITRLGGVVVSPPGDAVIRFQVERSHSAALVERLGTWGINARPGGSSERAFAGAVPRIAAVDVFVIALPRAAPTNNRALGDFAPRQGAQRHGGEIITEEQRAKQRAELMRDHDPMAGL
jgi:hypothetical protein